MVLTAIDPNDPQPQRSDPRYKDNYAAFRKADRAWNARESTRRKKVAAADNAASSARDEAAAAEAAEAARLMLPPPPPQQTVGTMSPSLPIGRGMLAAAAAAAKPWEYPWSWQNAHDESDPAAVLETDHLAHKAQFAAEIAERIVSAAQRAQTAEEFATCAFVLGEAARSAQLAASAVMKSQTPLGPPLVMSVLAERERREVVGCSSGRMEADWTAALGEQGVARACTG